MNSRKKLVLILEDIDSYSSALQDGLKNEACSVVVKTTQSSARDYLKKTEPDLIFCDGEAPDGAFIHAIPPGLWGRVIAISGSRGYNDAMKQKGAAATVPKIGIASGLWAEKAVSKARPLLAS